MKICEEFILKLPQKVKLKVDPKFPQCRLSIAAIGFLHHNPGLLIPYDKFLLSDEIDKPNGIS